MASLLQQRVNEFAWYHTLELDEGVVTRGYVDTRPVVSKVPLPESLAGKRCLDVGTQNGYWAFELERRGATSVMGIDLDNAAQFDWPARRRLEDPLGMYQLDDRDLHRRSFELAKEALGSKVEWKNLSVYRLSRSQVGEFDFVFAGSILLHLRDPVRARSVCGRCVVAKRCSLM